jgi:RimJ/RimL family protein N-acetyltransferase
MPTPLLLPVATARLVLRPFTAGDLPTFHELYSREDVWRYIPFRPESVDDSRAVLERISRMTAIGDEDDALRLAMTLPGPGALIGDVSLWRTSREHSTGEIGFVLHPDHQGHGYAGEAAAELLRIGFEVGAFHRIVGRCDARNTPSAKLMQRLGMRREAYHVENEIYRNEWTDELVFAMLDREWQRRRAGLRR